MIAADLFAVERRLLHPLALALLKGVTSSGGYEHEQVWSGQMNRDEAVALAEAKLRELGIPAHLCSVRKIPAQVEIAVLIGTKAERVVLRSGVTCGELAEKLASLETSWRNRDCVGGEQTDLEQAINMTESETATESTRRSSPLSGII